MSNEPEPCTITTTSTSLVEVPSNGHNIKRHVTLYHYGIPVTKLQPLRRLLTKHKCWREAKAIIYEDSTMKVFDDSKLRDPIVELKLENVALYMAFGKAANKYGPPTITDEESNYISPNNYFAVAESKEIDKVHWFAAKDESGWKDLIGAIAETLEGKVNPPQLGKGPKFRYTHDQENKWKTYWITCAQQPNAFELAEENGESKQNQPAKPIHVPTPLVAVIEQKKAAEEMKKAEELQKAQESKKAEELRKAEELKKAEQQKKAEDDQKKAVEGEKKIIVEEQKAIDGHENEPMSEKSPPSGKKSAATSLLSKFSVKKPLPLLRHQPPRDYYKIDTEMPEAGILNYENIEGLAEESAPKMVVRLVGGKRVREIVDDKPQEISPSTLPPQVEPKLESGENIEAVILRIEESSLLPFENVEVEPVEEKKEETKKVEGVKEEMKTDDAKKEEIEVFTSQHRSYVNAANVEYTITTSEHQANGIDCSLIKEEAAPQ